MRYSLRSLRFLPHGRVWVVGYRPSWVTDVVHVPTDQARLTAASKRENAWANLRALAEHGPAEFVYMEDDYHLLAPHPVGVTAVHRGPLANHVAEYRAHYPRSHYTRLLAHTLDHLGPGALSWDVHAPIPVVRTLLADVLAECEAAAVPDDGGRVLRPLWRTVYGTRYLREGRQVTDPKVLHPKAGAPMVSTSDVTWPHAGRVARRAHAHPGPYEA